MNYIHSCTGVRGGDALRGWSYTWTDLHYTYVERFAGLWLIDLRVAILVTHSLVVPVIIAHHEHVLARLHQVKREEAILIGCGYWAAREIHRKRRILVIFIPIDFGKIHNVFLIGAWVVLPTACPATTVAPELGVGMGAICIWRRRRRLPGAAGQYSDQQHAEYL